MENILKVFLMAFPEWLAVIFMVVGLVVTALAAVRLGYGLVVAKTVYKWIVNAEEKFGSGAGAEKKAHVIAVLRGYTPDWLDWAINERTLDWIVQIVFNFTKKKLEDYMEKKSAETTTVAHFGNVGENNYIEKGYIDLPGLKNVEYLYKSYHALGGNGTGTELYTRAKALPIRDD